LAAVSSAILATARALSLGAGIPESRPMTEDSSGEPREPRSPAWRPRSPQAWIASAAAIVGIATGIFTLRDQLFGSDDGPAPPQGDGREVPYFNDVASHLEESRDLIGFLQTHDGDAVQLEVGFQLGLDDFSVDGFGVPSSEPDALPRITLYTECTPPLSPAEQEQFDLGFRDQLVIGRCFGDELLITGPDTDESGIYVIHGNPRIEGYFLVDIGDLHMGFTAISLKPINFQEAIART
jgi:hypothetical protein